MKRLMLSMTMAAVLGVATAPSPALAQGGAVDTGVGENGIGVDEQAIEQARRAAEQRREEAEQNYEDIRREVERQRELEGN